MQKKDGTKLWNEKNDREKWKKKIGECWNKIRMEKDGEC